MVSNYASRATKPEKSLYQRRLVNAISRLPDHCPFKKRFCSISYAVVGAQEVRSHLQS
jgi:hypothetical protein